MSLHEHRRNTEIRAPNIRLIDENGEMKGIVSRSDALTLAEDMDMDLVEIQPTADPPVCRIMNYGKFRYEQQKKAGVARKTQKQIEIKEVQFRIVIDQHDYQTKLNHVREFLTEGNKVRLVVRLKGRERNNPELGRTMIARLVADLADAAQFADGWQRESGAQGGMLMVLASPTTRLSAKPKT